LRQERLGRPDDPVLIGQMQRTLYFLCEYDELLDLCTRYPDHPASPTNTGWACIRKGELEKALAVLTEEIDRNPRAAVAYYGRAWVNWLLADTGSALRDTLRTAELDPGWSGGFRLRLLYGREPEVFTPFWAEIERVCASAVRRKTWAQPRYLGFRALARIHGPDRDPEQALRLASEAVACAEAKEPSFLAEALALLAEVRFARGEEAEAIRALERAERLPGTWGKSSRDLAEYRRRHFPHLASCASVDAFLRGDLHDGGDPLLDLDRVEAALADGPRTAQVYLQARVLERHGRHEEALRLVEDLVAADASAEPELVLALADWTAREGRIEAALALIEGRFGGAGDPILGPWTVWMRIGSEGGLTATELSKRLSALSPRSPQVSGLLWLLREMEETGAIRINCGGPDYIDASGQAWGRDRFHEGGESYGNPRPEIAIERDRDLYYDNRRFLHGDWAHNTYRIPLPTGKYEVTLRFCAVDRRPEERRFRLAVEEETIWECIDLVREPGIGAVREERLDVVVADGALEILVEPAPRALGIVNAIEIRLLGNDEAKQ
ncbi:MAG: tetratricopeptide repeat protein, partial [Planctomycetes bacterium]|nr:tetratricopeptide repeat protein [Planctomycetota bacterium]